jgi:hypothetical protein
MTEFMHRRPVPIDGLEIRLGPRHLDEIVDRTVKGAFTADAEVSAGGVDQGLGVRQDKPLGNRHGSGHQPFRQVLALVGIEHREAFQEWNRVRLVSVALGPPAFVVGREAVRVDDCCAVLSLANIAAEAKRLSESEPGLTGEAALDDGGPEDQHVDPGIAALGRRVLRHGDRSFRLGGPPRLNPGHTAGLQLGDDLVGDFLIEARPVSTSASASD